MEEWGGEREADTHEKRLIRVGRGASTDEALPESQPVQFPETVEAQDINGRKQKGLNGFLEGWRDFREAPRGNRTESTFRKVERSSTSFPPPSPPLKHLLCPSLSVAPLLSSGILLRARRRLRRTAALM